ncbi:RtcB family protein [Cellulomonas sp. SG140]|uniref:RtcB family protein n=1 Tax=Cellulomonas sp. SG140 TaxID=2976536 RepID=UPI0021E81548|nr:RtcB family protein [Cellulomonas sp. SG140]
MEKITDKLLSWASILEPKTREQAIRTAAMPFVQPHMALMPDAHLGKGATVGSVIPTEGAIMPAAVGVDIGCGMDAVLTQWTIDDLQAIDYGQDGSLRRLREEIERAIPLSAGKYNTELTATAIARLNRRDGLHDLAARAGFDPAVYAPNWERQLGSLGSGNHFIEISLDELDRVWIFLHSGSRGVGNKLAQHHIKVAQEQMRRRFIELEDPDLAYLIEGEPAFAAYIAELRWAQAFARENRAEMMDRVVLTLSEFMQEDVESQEHISCHHNYTQRERHFGRDLWVSRKGAIDAHEGVMGLIPGSMGTRSYVVRGRGNVASLSSAPHGAGREYSRAAARKAFTFEQLDAAMEGIEYRRTDAFIDEIPAAYKPIDVIMRDAEPLVEVVHELRQIVNVKGD